MSPLPTPEAEQVINADLVRALLASQRPDLVHLPLRDAGAGWDNCLFRLGDDLVVRLPRRAMAVSLVENEIRWLPVLAPQLSLPVPTAVHVGTPDHGYPWPWTITRWFDGDIASSAMVALAAEAPRELATFLSTLHQPASSQAPLNPFRQSLSSRAGRLEEHLAHVELGAPSDIRRPGGPGVDVVRAIFRESLAAPPWPAAPVWLHGDLHPGNLVVREGRLVAVIDFGDLTSGDPAVDLACAWMLWDREGRSLFRDEYVRRLPQPDQGLWQRARAWAVVLSVAWLAFSADEPVMERIGRRAIEAACADGL